jgi:hypothetical protein
MIRTIPLVLMWLGCLWTVIRGWHKLMRKDNSDGLLWTWGLFAVSGSIALVLQGYWWITES